MSPLKPAQLRLKNIFTYIRELTKLRTPPASTTSNYEWEMKFSTLPSYPSIQTYLVPENPEQEFDGIILRIKRPKETPCPKPPTVLEGWLENGWEKLEHSANHIAAKNTFHKSDNQTVTEKFENDNGRVIAFTQWHQKRNDWLESERPVRDAISIFSEFFGLHGQLQRESEKFQLYLGDGHLVWQSAIEAVEHPILLKKVQLEFNSAIPEFIIRDSDEDADLYTSLLRHHELDGKSINTVKTQIENNPVHPLMDGSCNDFFKFFIHTFFEDGQFVEDKSSLNKDTPSIYRDPILFLGGRTQGFTEALDKLIEATNENTEISEALLRIVGVDEKVVPAVGHQPPSHDHLTGGASSEIDFLLTKPANKEQERVIERLETTGSVLVQGPPGTGKSHTIANIIGHLLASGKTVLVSSHTSKALRVVRDKVAKDLQPLCVSVLENDTVSKSQLEESVNGIVSYLSRTDTHTISKEISQLRERRTAIKRQLVAAEDEALKIRKDEYEDILIAGEGIPPSEAARRVAEAEELHSWIPLPIKQGSPLNLTVEEIKYLYISNGLLSQNDEACLEEGLPNINELIEPSSLNELLTHISSILPEDAEQMSSLWEHRNQDFNELDKLAQGINKSLDIFNANEWVKKVVDETRLSEEHVQPWLSLMEQVNRTTEQIAIRSEIILKYGPKINVDVDEKLLATTKSVHSYVKAGKKVGFLNTAFNSDWKLVMTSTSVDSGVPTKEEHFASLVAAMECHLMRKELLMRWERQVCSIGGPPLDNEKPEAKAKSLLHALSLASNWNNTIWKNLETELRNQGFKLKDSVEKITASSESMSHIQTIQKLVAQCLVPAINSRKLWVRLNELEAQRRTTSAAIRSHLHKNANASVYLHKMIEAIDLKDIDLYRKLHAVFLDLHLKQDIFNKRKQLINALKIVSPAWSQAIAERSSIHGSIEVPGDILETWKITQWKQEIDRRTSKDYSRVQREISRLKTDLQEINAQYVEKLSWQFQFSRTGLAEKQALTGWQQLQKRMTKTGKGKFDSVLRREAQKTLKNCKNAVPVWIMPLSRVFDSFDLVATKFDVIILDEASQSDITALVAFAIAKQVIVVGDKEQVTPYAVGQNLGQIQVLIDQILHDVPNKYLYTGKTSVYDLAEQSFGETIRLIEHFRCVPDIIQFSNHLSYGDIRPLREAASSPFEKHLIAHRIQGASSNDKKNKKEAIEVASIISAMTESNEYSKSSIGVISMVGTEQAILIDSILQKKLPTDKYAKHSLLCGNASQFQGDERDVILISIVDTCENPPLSIRQDESFQKTFNVASSRARDQLWVVHSLNPSTDLKPGDLRLRLIQHAEDPKELETLITATQAKADPKSKVFEPMVIKDLMQAGFRVIPQWKVGAYTIDMVIEGDKKRIAIECDGDRYHPIEKISDDIQRQMVLERLGWRFIRIRGTEYFRHKKRTMERVISELEGFGIERLGPVGTEAKKESQVDLLHQQILLRAEEIRTIWLTEEDVVEVKPKRNRWGKQTKKTSDETPPFLIINDSKQTDVSTLEVRNKVIETPKETSQPESEDIIDFIHQKGFETIDKRNVGGSLWVIDHPDFKKIKNELESRGWKFAFAPNGSASTKKRPGWYSKK